MDPHARQMHMTMASIRWCAENSIEGSIADGERAVKRCDVSGLSLQMERLHP
jgi:hypothetical protein